MSFLSRASPPTIFPRYLLQASPFRRRKSYTESNNSTGSTDSTGCPARRVLESPSYLDGHNSYLRCGRCAADLCLTSAIVSRGFTGRWGRAYLVSVTAGTDGSCVSLDTATLPNTQVHKPVPRQLVTGAHTVSDVSCVFCESVLGWKYVAAEEESQRYKVGKFILETKRVSVSTCWEFSEGEEARKPSRNQCCAPDNTENVEFDSQDEDECEDLFSGVWTATSALQRRQARIFGRGGAR